MPNTALEDALKEAYATAQSDVAILNTVEISHPALPDGTIYLVRNLVDLDLTIETSEVKTFTAAAFRVTLPAVTDEGLQELTLTFDNVDRRISDFLKAVKEFAEPTVVTFRPYLANDFSKPQMDPPLVLYLTDVTVNLFEASGKASFADIINRKAPNDIYTRARFPSLGD